jgi:glycosyltransferase involved in cell wall biosynthesis
MPQYGYYPRNCHVSTVYWDAVTRKYPESGTTNLDRQIARGLKKSDRIVVWFDENKRDLEMHYPGLSEKAIVLPFGVDLKAYFGEPRGSTSKSSVYDLIYVASSQPRKRLDSFLEICVTLVQEEKVSKICLVTNSVGKAFAEEKFPELKPHLTIESGVDRQRLRELYMSSKFLLNTSEYEGLGLPNLESVYLGTPVICRDIPIFREIFSTSCVYFKGDFTDNICMIGDTLDENLTDREGLWRRQYGDLQAYFDFETCYSRIAGK